MAEGYGFGAEGDWKTAALVRAMKVMGSWSWMVVLPLWKITPMTSMKKVRRYWVPTCLRYANRLQLRNPLWKFTRFRSVARLTRSDWCSMSSSGPAVNATLIDLGNRFRMIVNEVDVVQPEKPLSKLPVASAVWIPRPNLKIAAKWLDPGRWGSPYWLQPVRYHRASRRLR